MKYRLLHKKYLLQIIILTLLLTFSFPGQADELMISAAASLTDALRELRTSFEKDHPGSRIVFNFAASGTLAQQIESGAPVDLFISAAAKQMDKLEAKGLIVKESRKNILRNNLVLIVPKDSLSKVKGFEDLPGPSVQHVAIGDPRFVPAGLYAEQILRNLKLWDKITAKLVLAEDVRQVLEYVARDDVDAGIVFTSDAVRFKEKVATVSMASENLHEPVVYPAALVKGGSRPVLAKIWIDFMMTNEAKSIFGKYGFKTLE